MTKSNRQRPHHQHPASSTWDSRSITSAAPSAKKDRRSVSHAPVHGSTLPETVMDRAMYREVTRLLRLRFVWLCSLWLGLVVVQIGGNLIRHILVNNASLADLSVLRGMEVSPLTWIAIAGRIAALAFGLWYTLRRATRQPEILRTAYWVLIVCGLCAILDGVNFHFQALNAPNPLVLHPTQPTGSQVISLEAQGAVAWTVLVIALSHLFACFFLPWTVRQALMPLIILYPAWLILTLIFEGVTIGTVLAGGLISPLVIFIGLMWCWWREGRLRSIVELRTLRQYFDTSRRDLFDARRIHERRFPEPGLLSHVDFDFAYEPMRQVGGDFLHTHVDAQGAFHLMLIDVTGHGIAAALTVNRVDGEVKRLFGENPASSPGPVLEALNRYFYLTMARHGIFATALSLAIEPDGMVRWCNAGHPPAFLQRGVNGAIDSLDSTAFILGAVPDEVFYAGMCEIRLHQGDILVLYTDGAMEAADMNARQMGVEGLRLRLASWPAVARGSGGKDSGGRLVRFLLQQVQTYRSGKAQDDVLIASLRLHRPM